MSLLERSARDLLDTFAAPTPTPGGGSASALAGALGASLLLMVSRMPKTRTAAEAERASLDVQAGLLEGLRQRLAALVDEDSDAYDEVVRAFKLPKSTDEEKSARRIAVQQATRVATETPLAVMRACVSALECAKAVAAAGNPNAASDVRVGVGLLVAAAAGAYENVAINLPGLGDATVREALASAAVEAQFAVAAEQAAALAALRV